MRNQPCPCGSGKKYKKCCGAVSANTAGRHVPKTARHAADINRAAEMLRKGQAGEARKLLLSLLQSNPGNDAALIMLAGIAHGKGQTNEAIELVHRAIRINPGEPRYHNNLGGLYKSLNNYSKAFDCFRNVTELVPGNLHALLHMAECCERLGRTDDAITHYRSAAKLDPGIIEIHNALGSLYIQSGRINDAVDSFRRAYALKPGSGAANTGLGDALRMKGHFHEAIEHYEKALPDHGPVNPALIHGNIGICRQFTGNIDGAISSFQTAIQLSPAKYELRTNLLMALNYSCRHTPGEVYLQHTLFDWVHAAGFREHLIPHGNNTDPERPLKIGYVSSNFYQHSVASFIKPVIEHHDHSQFEIYGYHNNSRSDPVTESLKAGFAVWRMVKDVSDDDLAEIIRNDGIDILVDLNGHTADNRLLVFARKPAPVQVSWIGYPNTTGLDAMDYRLTDGFADPPGETDHLHSERLIRLPDSFSCYSPPDPCPEVAPLPVLENGFITFGSFNNFAKITPEVIAVWCKLLNKCPDSRLLLKAELFQDEEMRHRISGIFHQAGIAHGRVELISKDASRLAHLERYGQVDIALDTFPYSGTTTTCEALWMGVPVITLAGKVHAGRVGVSQLKAIGLDMLIAESPEQYTEITSGLAADPNQLKMLRATMRRRMAASPLMAAVRFTGNLETAYRTIWRDWCNS